MLDIGRSHESRAAFVEPEMIPVATSHHVAPPLMRKLVRTKPEALFVVQQLLAVSFSQSRETAHLLLDPARREHLRVRSIGILNTRLSFEEVEHVGRFAKDASDFVLVVVCREVLQLNLAVFLLENLKWTSRKTEDISGKGCALLPLGDTSVVWQFALRNELTEWQQRTPIPTYVFGFA